MNRKKLDWWEIQNTNTQEVTHLYRIDFSREEARMVAQALEKDKTPRFNKNKVCKVDIDKKPFYILMNSSREIVIPQTKFRGVIRTENFFELFLNQGYLER